MTGEQQAPCRHTPIFGGRRRGPSVERPAYQLAMNGEERLFFARYDVATWPDRIYRIAQALKPPTAGV